MYRKVTGPYYISLTRDHDTYRIRDVKTNKDYGCSVHLSRLRPYRNRELFNTKFAHNTRTTQALYTTNQTTQPVQTQTTQKSEWFAVDRILKSKIINGKKHYFIKWKGKFPNSREPEEHVSDHCKQQFNIKRTQQGRLRKQFQRERTNK